MSVNTQNDEKYTPLKFIYNEKLRCTLVASIN